MNNSNFNYDCLTSLVDSIASDLVKDNIHPNYLKIRGILKHDFVKDHRDFADRYGTGIDKFKKIYLKGEIG